jgi:DNA gyrase/topoisomerase IV subunit B
MKKTINIDNRLYEGLKREAEISGQTMTAIINQAIARHLELLTMQEAFRQELQRNPDKMLEIVERITQALPMMDEKHRRK